MLRSSLASLFSARTWPSSCRICHDWPAQAICRACEERFQAHEQIHSLQGHLQRAGLGWNWVAALPYAYPWANLISDFKFHGQWGLAGHLTGIMLQQDRIVQTLCNCDCLIPVPVHASRLAQRGYNQTALLARSLQKLLKREHAYLAMQVKSGALLRAQAGSDQVGLSERARWHNVRKQFILHPDAMEALRGKRIVVLDDIMTTGATLHHCIQALLPSQPATISALTLAKTL